MTYPQRRSIRLRGYDYSQEGAYFVTIVTQGRALLFGDVVDSQMELSPAGECVLSIWRDLPTRFPRLVLDEFVVTPNHVHGILLLNGPVGAALVAASPTARVGRVGLSEIIGAYKSLTTVEYGKGVRRKGWEPYRVRLWQRGYYEHIVRDEESLLALRRYIRENPARWSMDPENPQRSRHKT